MDVKNKQDSFRLWHAGVFGNKLQTWNCFREIIVSRYTGTVSMRYMHKNGGGSFVAYDVPVHEIPTKVQDWKNAGAIEELITYNESAPDDKLVIQGEVCLNPSYVLFYSRLKEKMRDALRSGGEHAAGIKAKMILETAMTPSSYSDLQTLMELYPDSIIEFSTYSVCLGDRPGRNTVIWEVRNY